MTAYQNKAAYAYLLTPRALDWTPRAALDDGLTKAIAYFRDANGGTA